jgi:protein TonB
MNREISPDQLDNQIQLMLSIGQPDELRHPLISIASELRLLPCDEFRDKLKDELLVKADGLEGQARDHFEFRMRNPELSMLTQRQFSMLPTDPRSFLFSFLSHAAAVVLIASGIWISRVQVVKMRPLTSDLTYLAIPPGPELPHGGGGGGDHSWVQASRGTTPKFNGEQLAPPAIVVRNPTPKLQVEPTVLGPPQIQLPLSDRIGDLWSTNVTIPSNGLGSPGGVGRESGMGLGPGNGAGLGPGSEAGFSGETFRAGNGVSAPQAIYNPDSDFSDEARRAKHQGIVVLSLVVDPAGRARNIRIVRALGMGLDEKAIEAVQKWQFAPGMKDGHAIAVQVNVELNFRLLSRNFVQLIWQWYCGPRSPVALFHGH